MLGSPLQTPSDVVAYGGSEAPILGINNPTPYNHGGSSILSINNGSNETWVDTGGAIHQLNTAVQNELQGTAQIGTGYANNLPIDESGNLMQTQSGRDRIPAAHPRRRPCGITQRDHHSHHRRADVRQLHPFGCEQRQLGVRGHRF